MVSSMGGNVGEDKGCDKKVISTAMDTGSGDTRYGKDVYVCQCVWVWKVMCECEGVWKVRGKYEGGGGGGGGIEVGQVGSGVPRPLSPSEP